MNSKIHKPFCPGDRTPGLHSLSQCAQIILSAPISRMQNLACKKHLGLRKSPLPAQSGTNFGVTGLRPLLPSHNALDHHR